MAMSRRNSVPTENRLLARLPRDDIQRWAAALEPLSFTLRDVLYKPGAPVKYVYFPATGLLTHLVTMRDGGTVEAGAVGKEGLIGLPALLNNGVAQLEVRVQVPGDGLRLPIDAFRSAAQRPGVRELLLRYAHTFLFQVQQSAACNRLHLTAQRCCRWLLTAHDAAPLDPLRLTQAGLATLLGVRRASVTEVAQVLQQDGLIRYSRGKISVLNRTALEARSCDCYRIIRKAFDDLLG